MTIVLRFLEETSRQNSVRPHGRSLPFSAVAIGWLCVAACLCAATPLSAQSDAPAVQQQAPATPPAPAKPGSQTSQPNTPTLGVITGTVTDSDGALAVGAKVSLFAGGLVGSRDVMTGNNGDFSFADVPAGPFHLRVTAPGFDTQQYWGQIQPGQALLVPPIKLPVTGAVTEVNVGGSPEEIAQIEVKQELQQRVFGFIPNFYVTYTTDPPPLFAKQKFDLAWRSVIDPVTIVGVAFLAGVYQAADTPGGYGQGAEGYGRRFGAAYGDVVFGTYIGSAILPSILHQDPRYFYLGPDYSMKKRWERALANAVIARNDRSKKWEPNYSGIIGSFAAAGISYTYLPPSDRTTGLYLEDALVRLGESSVAGILQEFILRKFTSHVPKQSAVSP
jgi:Carboxypeptidase regulatory-like domain